MRKLFLTCLAAGTILSSAHAQTLFTYGGHPVSKEAFLKVYEKNSLNKKPDFSEHALRDYLKLYSLFRMKVAEAESQDLDTIASVQRELDNYRRQLARNYLTDQQVTERLMHEAYDRMKEDVHVAHILIACRPGTDTVAAYRKIDSLYHVLKAGKASFADLAKQYSDDKDTRNKGGDVGYITALQTIYPFENVAYSTPVGEISKPFHTQFGYHILKVIDKRRDIGKVEVAQILLTTPKSEGEKGIEVAHKRADSIETALKHGASFTAMVKKYSQDKFSVNNNGVLPEFGVGHMVPAFEKAAFSLKKPGDVSAPVKTSYGFHIIKLIKKDELKPYDSLEPELKRKVENDFRAQVARDAFFAKVKAKNGFKEYQDNYNNLVDKVNEISDSSKLSNNFTPSQFKGMEKPLFELGGKHYSQLDFINFAYAVTHGRLMGPKDAVVKDLYNMYVSNVVNDFEEHKLVEENPEFKSLMEEYKDGILLFELMDRNVWGKASKDTTGLEAFYNAHKDKFMWEPGFKGSVYKFKTEAAMKEGIKMLSKRKTTDEDLSKKLNTEATPDAVTIQHGHYEFSRFKDVPKADIKEGKPSMGVKNSQQGYYVVVKADKVYDQPTQKTLDEARGYVVAEYQDYLEKKWDKDIRAKYPLKVNEQVFMSMVKK